MKYICFGYLDAEKWEKIPPAEQTAMIDRCLAYVDTLKKNGHWVSGEGLQGPDSTVSLRKLIHLRTCSKRLASGASRICLRTLRAKKGETSGPATRPRRSHNSWSSSGFIFFPKIELPIQLKVALGTGAKINIYVPGASKKPSSCRIRVGCRILRSALASIWRIRSRVTWNWRPTSSSVRL